MTIESTHTTRPEPSPGPSPAAVVAGADEPAHRKRGFNLGLERFSGVYVLVALCVGFSIWLPSTFATSQDVRVIATSQGVTGLLALGLVLPLAAGVFDLSIAGAMGLSSVVAVKLQSSGWNPFAACVVGVLSASLVGVINGTIVTRLRVDSFIVTLGMGSVLVAAANKVTNQQQIVNGISPTFLKLSTYSWFGIPSPVYYLAAVALVLWFVLEHRPVGRYLYAVGGNREAARLAGLRVNRIVFGSMVAGSTMAGLAGILLASEIGIGDPTSGPPFLLPVFSAVFLGATQFRPGRVNVIGTLLAIYLLAVGVKGLQLGGAPSYVNDLFNGLALIVAVCLAAYERRKL